MSKHTPGPWTAGSPAWFRGRSNPEDGKRPITAGNSPVIANVYGASNARLIAAAPELLEALKSLLPGYGWSNYSDEELVDEDRLGNGAARHILAARAAIAKATGL